MNAAALLEVQRRAAPDRPSSWTERIAALDRLRAAVRQRERELLAAVSEDFGGRAAEETMVLELFPLYDQIRHTRANVRAWMRRRRVAGTWFLLPARAFYEFQPVGVVGVIGAWNYPLLLTLGPVVEAIAAGNRVMVKPSEFAPRTAALVGTILADAFPPEFAACVTGGAEVGAAFAALPFDHIFFTGSTRTGTRVMQTAAANLTPVTLELGGKSPAVIHASFPLALAAERIMKAKLYNSGQTCVAPDYVMLQHGSEAAFEAEAVRVVTRMYPTIDDNADYTRIISAAHAQRLRALVADAAAQGARVVTIGTGAQSGDARVVPPTLVFGATAAMALMQEEIFGPVLPVVSYRTIDEAIAFINERPRPLALYYFDNGSRRVDDVLARTRSGGVTVNDCIYHLVQHGLPFGGTGASGMGSCHGFDGFQTFSRKRAVMVQSRWTVTALFQAPYRNRRRILERLIRIAGSR